MWGLMLLQVVVTSFKSQKCQQGSYKKDDGNLMQKQQSPTAALAETLFQNLVKTYHKAFKFILWDIPNVQ